LEFQPAPELLRKVRELLLAREGAQHHKYLLPFLKISVLHDVREIIGDNALE
jgi:hypothetical protein